MPALFALLALFAPAANAAARASLWSYRVVATRAHDIDAFTQGLVVHRGQLIESTGRYGHSALIVRDLATGLALRRVTLASDLFGEGAAVAGNRIVQLTWKAGLALVYDLKLKPVARFRYDGEGWGLAFDGKQLLMSDGSAHIALRRPDTFEVTGGFDVRDGGAPVARLNELEVAHQLLFANVWETDRIAVIDPASGTVRGWLDLAALRQGMRKPDTWDPREHVLNGIAFDPATGHFYVTGKCWPVLFEIAVDLPRDPVASSASR